MSDNKSKVNKTCVSIVLCLNDNQDALNCSRLIVKFDDGTRIRFNIDIENSFDFDHLSDILFTKIKEVDILEDYISFKVTKFNDNDLYDIKVIRLNIKALSFYWRA